jgi:tetratricopeptide (TPR) repeat protein
MGRFDRRSPLPAFGLMAAILSASSLGLSQAPTTVSDADTQPVQPAAPQIRQATPVEMGDALMARQRYQAAIEAYKKAPQDDATAWNKLGIAYQMMFNVSDAMRCYEKSLKLNPKNPTVLNNLGTTYDAMKQYRSAEKMYRKALKIDPKSALVMKNLGTDLLAQHKYKKGWEYYKAALVLDPAIFDHTSRPHVENPASVEERGAMNYYMAKGCVRAGMPERAIAYLRAAINEGFTNPKKIIADNEFAGLHGIPEFEELLAAQTRQ